MIDAMSVVIGLTITAISTIIGYRARTVSHAILPIRDPIFVSILVLETIVLLLDVMGIMPIGGFVFERDVMIITDNGSLLLLCICALDVGYLLGYAMCRPSDMIQLDLPRGDQYQHSDVVPLVYYYGRNGALYTMPQTIGGIVMSFLGARHPLDMPVHEISRMRSYTVDNGGIRRPMEVAGAVTVSLHEIEDFEIGLCRIGSRKIRDENRNVIAESPMFLFHPTVTAHRIRFAQSATDDYQSYLIKTDLYKDAITETIGSKEDLARLQIQLQAMQYDAAADIVSGIISMTKDAPGAHDEIIRIIDRVRRQTEEVDDHADT